MWKGAPIKGWQGVVGGVGVGLLLTGIVMAVKK
jgi:hypothetical protein